MRFVFSDEDGFISLANAGRYQGFVGEDWQFDGLMRHFVAQMNARHLLIWASNSDGGGEWNIEVLAAPSDEVAFRTLEFPVTVTDGALYLVSYTDLTMVAQFADEELSVRCDPDLRIALDNGEYGVTVRQMFDPDDYDDDDEDEAMTHFELILEPLPEPSHVQAGQVFWLD